jgi:crossover junction endodeoxyribonuclease RusA
MSVVTFDILSRTYTPAPDHMLSIPCPEKWMNKNNRRRTHWSVDAKQTEVWRQAAGWAAKASKLSALGPSLVVAELHVRDEIRGRVDPANFNLTACAAIDGLVDVGVWPDDSSQWVIGPDMRLGPAVAWNREALVLLIWSTPKAVAS